MDVNEAALIRDARVEDHDDVREMTADTWPDRDGGDYLGRVYPRWIEADDLPKRTLVVEVDDRAVAIAQCVILSEYEAWGQGLRVHPEYRRQGLSRALTAALFDWAREQGATVMRAMVFSWNVAGLGQARSTGYRPSCSFRWVHPDPEVADRSEGVLDDPARPHLPDPRSVSHSSGPRAAWTAFRASRVDRALGGLTLSLDESWAVAELTPAILERAATETAVLALHSSAGTLGMSYRTRAFEREDADGESTLVAEYGVAVWDDVAMAAEVLDAIAADAADQGASRTRVLVPESPTMISDVALLDTDIADHPDFIVSADLSGTAPLTRH